MENRIPAADFAAWLKARAGEGCVSGASGEDAALLPEWMLSGQYAGQELASARAWNGRVWSPSGLASGFCRERAGMEISAPPLYILRRWCGVRGRGELPPEYCLPGAALFRISGESCHMGFLLDKQTVIEARNAMQGVVCAPLREGGWNAWGLMTRCFDYGPVPQLSLPLGGRLLRRSDCGEDVLLLQSLMKTLGWPAPAGGSFCGETEAALRRLQAAMDVRCTGVYDEGSHDALMARIAPFIPEERAVRALPEANAPLLTVGAENLPLIFEMENWKCVRVFGRTGWVRCKYG